MQEIINGEVYTATFNADIDRFDCFYNGHNYMPIKAENVSEAIMLYKQMLIDENNSFINFLKSHPELNP